MYNKDRFGRRNAEDRGVQAARAIRAVRADTAKALLLAILWLYKVYLTTSRPCRSFMLVDTDVRHVYKTEFMESGIMSSSGQTWSALKGAFSPYTTMHGMVCKAENSAGQTWCPRSMYCW